MATFYLLAPFDPIPGEAGHPARFASVKRAIEARGHRCIWWTSHWDHATKSARVAPDSTFDIRLLAAPPYRQNISWARLRNHRALASSYRKEAQSAIRSGALPPPDLQLVSMPPVETLQSANSIQKEEGGEIVVDIMDTWPDSFFQILPFPGRRLRRGVGKWLLTGYRRMLRNSLRNCRGATAQSKGFLEWARERGLGDKPGHVCYLGANLPKNVDIRSLKKGEVLRLAYMGAMGTSYDLETLLRAVKRFAAQGRDVRLDLVGTGQKEPWMKSFVKREGLADRVFFHGYLPKAEAFALLDECHLGLVPIFPESGVTVPYKAGEYASRGLGIIYSLGGELDALLHKAGAGLRYEAGRVESMVKQLRAYMDNTALVAQQSRAAWRLARDQFNRAVSYPEMAEFLEKMADAPIVPPRHQAHSRCK